VSGPTAPPPLGPPPGPPPLEPSGGASAAAPAAPAPGEGRTYPCERCGADLVFNIGAQRLKCEHCGFEKDLDPGALAQVSEHDLEEALSRQAARRRGEAATPGALELTCTACGATVAFDGTLTATTCAYCGEPVQRDQVHEAPERIKVDGLLTFAVEAAEARAGLAAWVRRLWFAPSEFVRRGVDGRLEGVYLPFFTFDAMTATTYRGERGDHYWVEVGSGNDRRRERRTRWTPAWGDFQRFFDDVLVPAVRALPQGLLDRLEPWPLARVIPFAPAALAGKRAHTYDVELLPSFATARQEMEAALADEVRRRIGGDEQRVLDLRTGWAGLTYKHLLLPVWLLAYRYQGTSYRVAVNACTGEVQGERPWSPWKIGAAVVLGVVAAGVFAWLAQQH
jgi:DNA-directed RNA polymerase subunit RPC12/RpoP